MKTKNGTGDQDNILTECQDFGGKASEAAEVAADFDRQLDIALGEIERLKEEIAELKAKTE